MSAYDEGMLKNYLTEFQSKTGITPAVVTDNTSVWQEQYPTLERYAYYLYLSKFSDEKHWLIVYTTDDSSEFYWEGMQGDDTDGIISEQIADRFTAVVHSELSDREHHTVAESIADGFSSIEKESMKWSVNFANSGYLFFFMILWCSKPVYMLFVYIRTRILAKGYRCPDDYDEPPVDICSYCGNEYVRNIHTNCPYCGKPIIEEPVSKDTDPDSAIIAKNGW